MARLIADIPDEEHKYLKMCCAKLGVTIKEFVKDAIIEKVDSQEDAWMIERWKNDGTLEEIEKEMNDPHRIIYTYERINGEFIAKELTHQQILNEQAEQIKNAV